MTVPSNKYNLEGNTKFNKHLGSPIISPDCLFLLKPHLTVLYYSYHCSHFGNKENVIENLTQTYLAPQCQK